MTPARLIAWARDASAKTGRPVEDILAEIGAEAINGCSLAFLRAALFASFDGFRDLKPLRLDTQVIHDPTLPEGEGTH